MRRLHFVMLSALLLFGACGESQAPSPAIEPGGLALVGAQLIDGSGTAPIQDSVVVIRDGRIERAGSRATIEVPAGAEVVDT